MRGCLYKLGCFLALCVAAHSVESRSQEERYDFIAEYKSDQLIAALYKRLVIMHEVARTKWEKGLPIEDKERENRVVSTLAKQAGSYGLDEKRVARIFEAQIEAAKRVQEADFAKWTKEGYVNKEPILDLQSELRPYIDFLNQEILSLLAQIGKKGVQMYPSKPWLYTEPLTSLAWDSALKPFLE